MGSRRSREARTGRPTTGALITFSSFGVLRANIVNYTRGFPYVWDEVTVGITNDGDVAYTMEVVANIARRVVGTAMAGPVESYRGLLVREGLAYDVSNEPQIYIAPTESWVDLTVCYLAPARERRKWSSALHLEVSRELARPEHAGRIVPSYPVRRVRSRQERP